MTNQRKIALDVLMDITKNDAYNNIALKRELDHARELTQSEKAFVTKLVNGTLRNVIFIDSVIAQYQKLSLEKLNAVVLQVLRMSVYQLLYMDKVPPSAVLNEGVNLIKKRKLQNLSGFVNGVLRSILRDLDKIRLEAENIRRFYPAWLVALFDEQYGSAFTEDLLRGFRSEPDVSVYANTTKTTAAQLAQALSDTGMQVKLSDIPSILHLKKVDDLKNTKPYQDGLFHVIDGSGALAAQILNPQPGESILDACAAPGGKTMCLAALSQNKAHIVAGDIHRHKIDLLEQTAQRLGLTVETKVQDASSLDEAKGAYYDKLLLDVPCTGLGLLRKKPDILLKHSQQDIQATVALQRKILTGCHGFLKPGGILVYSTCTLTDAENINNIRWLQKEYGYQPVDITGFLPRAAAGPWQLRTAKEGYITLFPHLHGTDGFFIACMRKKESEGWI